MTDTTPALDAAATWARIEAQHAARTRLAADLLPANKAALFAALAAATLTRVVVTFDGSGDSGQIEGIEAYSGENTAALPSVDVEIASPTGDGSGVERRTLPIAEAVEQLAYDFLEETHGGWENNEGAYGEFTFDVAEQAIRLDYNERIETSEYYAHAW